MKGSDMKKKAEKIVLIALLLPSAYLIYALVNPHLTLDTQQALDAFKAGMICYSVAVSSYFIIKLILVFRKR